MKGAWLKAILLLPFISSLAFPIPHSATSAIKPCIPLVPPLSPISSILDNDLDYQWCIPAKSQIILGVILFCGGLGLFIKTTLLFHKVGQGTLSPLAPPKRLIIQGPYKIVRNPMLLGILFILLSEALLFSSCCIFIYTLIFFLINCIYFKTVEEKMLIKRFGQDYIAYRNSVPMWLPNFRGKCKVN